MLNQTKVTEAINAAAHRDEFAELVSQQLQNSTRFSEDRNNASFTIKILQEAERRAWNELVPLAEGDDQEAFDDTADYIIATVQEQSRIYRKILRSLGTDIAKEN